MTLAIVAELEAHQRPIGATSCDFTKARSAERRREPVIQRDGRTVGAGLDRARIEHQCAVLAGPTDSACEKRCRDALPAATRLGHETGDAPHPQVGGRSVGRGRRKATRAIPARHIGARTDLDPADRSPASVREQPGWRACLDARPEQLPRLGPNRRLKVAPRHAPVHAPALAANAAPIAKYGFQPGPPGWRQRSDLDLRRPGCVDGARHSLMLGGLPRAVKAGPMDWGRRVKRRSSWPISPGESSREVEGRVAKLVEIG
jgi:hypothetical protein